MKYKLVVFDFDGTLADTIPWFKGAINDVAEQYRFRKADEDDWEIIRNLDTFGMYKHLRVSSWKIPLVVSRIRALMSRDIQQVPLFAGTEQLLRGLSQRGVTLGIVSSNSFQNVRQVLGPENSALIKHYECGVALLSKANKLIKILNKSGVRHEESIYIGDEVRDCDAAQKANMPFAGVTWGFNTPSLLEAKSPTLIFENIQEILEKTS